MKRMSSLSQRLAGTNKLKSEVYPIQKTTVIPGILNSESPLHWHSFLSTESSSFLHPLTILGG